MTWLGFQRELWVKPYNKVAPEDRDDNCPSLSYIAPVRQALRPHKPNKLGQEKDGVISASNLRTSHIISKHLAMKGYCYGSVTRIAGNR